MVLAEAEMLGGTKLLVLVVFDELEILRPVKLRSVAFKVLLGRACSRSETVRLPGSVTLVVLPPPGKMVLVTLLGSVIFVEFCRICDGTATEELSDEPGGGREIVPLL